MNKPLIVLLLLSAMVFSANLQAQSVKSFEKAISEARKGKSAYVKINDIINAPDINKGIAVLIKYANDSVENVKTKAIRLLGNIGERSDDLSIRTKVVDQLTSNLSYPASGIIGTALDYLIEFKTEDFSVGAKQLVLKKIQSNTPHYNTIVKLSGFIKPEGIEPVLKSLLAADTINNQSKWNIRLALGRMGDQTSVDFIMRRLRTREVNDQLIYRVLPAMTYLKKAEMIDFLGEIVLSDEENCQPADMEQTGNIICGYQAMEFIAKMVNNFPLEADDEGYLETTDYDKALRITRDWLLKKPDFELKTEVY